MAVCDSIYVQAALKIELQAKVLKSMASKKIASDKRRFVTS